MQPLPPTVQPRRLYASILVALGVVVVCSGSLLLAATASAKSTGGTVIEINEGIGAVHLGQTPAKSESEAGNHQKSPDAKTWFYESHHSLSLAQCQLPDNAPSFQ